MAENNGILNTLKDRIVGGWGDSDEYINGTDYSLSFWKSVYSSPRIKSLMYNDTFFGELGHPDGSYRTREILPENVSHRINNIRFRDSNGIVVCHIDSETGDWIEDLQGVDYKNSKGDIIGDVDILDTPLGKILNTYFLAKANIGFSSRADGKTDYVTEKGVRKRVPDLSTYSLKGIDAVINPSKRDSRIIDEEIVDEEIENALIYTINGEVDEHSRAIMEEYVTRNIGNIPSHVFDVCFGNDKVTLTKKELLEIQNKFDNYRESLYTDNSNDLYQNSNERMAELIYDIIYSMKSNLEQKPVNEDVVKSTNDYDDLKAEMKIMSNKLEKSQKDLKKAILECSEKEENLKKSLQYIINREYPNFSKSEQLVNKVLNDEVFDLSRLRNYYNDLVFGNSGKSLFGISSNVSVRESEDKTDGNVRLKNLILGKRNY